MGTRLAPFARKIVLTALAVALIVPAIAEPAAARPAPSYTQPVFFEWDRMVLDVLIAPPQHGQIVNGRTRLRVLNDRDADELNPLANSYLKALEKAIADWRRAIKTFGSASLRRLKLNVYVLGRDVPPAAALQHPEIIITWDENKASILGRSSRFYAGDASTPCVIDNSQMTTESFSYPDMYNIAGHEFGHCLGLNHTTGAKGVENDLMHATYPEEIGNEDTGMHCMSNLHVRGLELVYDGKAKPTSVTIPTSTYKKIPC
jgi:hypothetical protein